MATTDNWCGRLRLRYICLENEFVKLDLDVDSEVDLDSEGDSKLENYSEKLFVVKESVIISGSIK
jgi:hypothetical protein